MGSRPLWKIVQVRNVRRNIMIEQTEHYMLLNTGRLQGNLTLFA